MILTTSSEEPGSTYWLFLKGVSLKSSFLSFYLLNFSLAFPYLPLKIGIQDYICLFVFLPYSYSFPGWYHDTLTMRNLSPTQTSFSWPLCQWLLDIATRLTDEYLKFNMSKNNFFIFPAKPALPSVLLILTDLLSITSIEWLEPETWDSHLIVLFLTPYLIGHKVLSVFSPRPNCPVSPFSLSNLIIDACHLIFQLYRSICS